MEQVLGWVAVLLVGVPLSIALHEIGHLVPAKKFGIKCSQYMIGFGPTLWSRRVGETEYGIKAFPLGGYVRMIGMYPPRRPQRGRLAEPGRWTAMVEQARADARAEVGPDDGDRQFYQRSVPRRIVVMLGGPLMNLLIAVLVIGGIAVFNGLPKDTTTIATVSRCVLPIDAPASATCSATDRPAPAAAAGIRSGDRIVRFAGVRVTSWEQARELIRSHGDQQVPVTVVRDGRTLDLTLTPILDERPVLDANGQAVRGSDGRWVTERVGFAGLSPTSVLVKQPVGAVPGVIWNQVSGTARLLVSVPAKMVGVAKAAAGLEERDPTGPVSVIGVGRLAGEIASGKGAVAGVSVTERVVGVLSLVGSLNLALFVFNLVPLLPLDGGHIAGALWEAVRRAAARMLRRPDPGPVDTIRALPLIYAVATVLIGMGLLLMYTDLVNPIRLGG